MFCVLNMSSLTKPFSCGGTEGNTLYLKRAVPPSDLCKVLPIPPWEQTGGLRNPLTQSGVQRGNAHHLGQAGLLTCTLLPKVSGFVRVLRDRSSGSRLDQGCGEQVWGRCHRPGAGGSWWKEMGPRKWGDTGWGKDEQKVYRSLQRKLKSEVHPKGRIGGITWASPSFIIFIVCLWHAKSALNYAVCLWSNSF